MPFKTHLIIISCIIAAVLLAWQFMQNAPVKPVEKENTKLAYSIAITHASWGLNCHDINFNNEAAQDPFLDKSESTSKLHEDNVLGAVSRICNGNTQCDVSLNEDDLGDDPEPNCPSKVLAIEYRCFSYDRPRYVKTSSTSTPVSIHCEQPPQ